MLGSISPRLAALLPASFKFPELRVRTRKTAEEPAREGSTPESLKALLSQLGKLRTSLERLQKTGRSTEIVPGGATSSVAAGTSSASALGLNTVATFATFDSTEEVNATPTSFSPFGPALIGSTTSDPTELFREV